MTLYAIDQNTIAFKGGLQMFPEQSQKEWRDF